MAEMKGWRKPNKRQYVANSPVDRRDYDKRRKTVIRAERQFKYVARFAYLRSEA